MSRVFWDSMLFIHLVEGHPTFAPIVQQVLGRSLRRGDSLHTSHLSVAETLVGITPGSVKEHTFLSTLRDLDFQFHEFGREAVEPFRVMRSAFGLKSPDAMNLACAAAVRMDIYLTNDAQLLKKQIHIPGIQFIADFKNAPL